MTDTLLLNADYSPLRILAWQRAVGLLMDDKVGMVAPYSDRVIRAQQVELPWPAVVALRRYSRFRPRVPFNRVHVLARDRATCQYCGTQPRTRTGRLDLERLTLDHVVPRGHAVAGQVVLPWTGTRVPVSSWQNVVAACMPCNGVKGCRTPEEAGMTLRAIPRKPDARAAVRLAFTRARIPDEWQDFIPDVMA